MPSDSSTPNIIPFKIPQEETETGVSSANPTQTAVEEAKTFMSGENGAGSKIKKILIFLLIFVVLAAVTGLAYRFLLPRFLNQGKEVNLVYWGLWEEEKILEGAITEYQKTHPGVKITYERKSPKEYRERLQSALAREEGPDIFRFHNTWVPMLKNELAPVPASVFDAAGFEATFYPIARTDLRLGGNYVGVPLGIDGLGLYVNTELFRAAGKSPPKTWDELRQTALELTVRDSQGQIQIAGVALGRTENVDHWSDILALMMLQNGADLNNPVGNLAEDALTYFTIFSQVDKVWDKTLPSSTLAFAGGKLAMYFAPSWRVFDIKTLNPKLSFEIVPVPQLPETNVTWASYWVEGVSKKSAHQEAAWEFLKYLSSKETLQALYQTASQTRLFGEPYSRIDMANLLETQPYIGSYVKQAPTARSWYLASQTFDNGLNEKIIKYFQDAVNSVNQGKTATEALKVAASGVSQILAQYGLSSPVVR